MLVEEGTGIPVEIEGSADGIGHLRVRLRRVVIPVKPLKRPWAATEK